MDIPSLHEDKDRISEVTDDILFDCLSLLEMKNAAQSSILSKRWRCLWTHWTILDFDPKVIYPKESALYLTDPKYETSKYFGWINQVVTLHRGPFIDKFRVRWRYVSSYGTQVDEWVKFALSKRVKELVLYFAPVDHSTKGYPLGFDILSHPPSYTGITTALQSLHLEYVNVSAEFLEFLLSNCHHLERLFLHTIPLSNFKVKTFKLKYLTVIMIQHVLEHLEIDAGSLLYFEYQDRGHEGCPPILFKSLPMLVETSFGGGCCRFPFPIFPTLSLLSNQLCKLSLEIQFDTWQARRASFVIPEGSISIFPNVKHFTCTIHCYPSNCILSLKRFIAACPMLEEFKLQVSYIRSDPSKEARELQLIDLEDGEDNVEIETDFNDDRYLEIQKKRQNHPNLRIMEVIGFLGVRTDIDLAFAVVRYAPCLKTIICDTRGVRYTGTTYRSFSYAQSEYGVAKMRARKLAKIVAPIKVVII